MTKRIPIALLSAVLLFGVVDCVREERPNSFFRATIPGRLGGFTITEHRRLQTPGGVVNDLLFPKYAWRLSHSSAAYWYARGMSNLGKLARPTDKATDNALRREIEQAFSLPAGSLDRYDVLHGDESVISQTLLVSPAETESYFIAMGYI